MTSLARRHRTRMLAAIAATMAVAAPARPAGAEATEYELQRARLGVDRRRLKEIQSIEGKIALKRELLPSYADWVAGVLDAAAAGNGGVQDDILTHVMIWRIDVGQFEEALPLAEYVLRYNIALPERFNSSAATVIAENIAEAAIKQLGQGEPFPLDILNRVDALTDGHDMPDQARAKLKKAMGLQLVRMAEVDDGNGPAGGKRGALEAALRHFRRAVALSGSVGVKKEIGKVERAIAKLEAGQE